MSDLHARIMNLQAKASTVDGLANAIERAVYKLGHRDARHDAAELAAAEDAIKAELLEALQRIVAATHSHVDGRDLLAELHPRNMLDIKRRIDGRETWFEGDWLTNLWREVESARAAIRKATGGVK